MLVNVRLFARLREIVGAAELRQDLPEPATARTAWRALAERYPDLAAYETVVSCAVNEEYARFDTKLTEGDEVAFLPPVSGGALPPERAERKIGASGFSRTNQLCSINSRL